MQGKDIPTWQPHTELERNKFIPVAARAKKRFLRLFLGSNAHFLMYDPHFFFIQGKDILAWQPHAKLELNKFITGVARAKKQFLRQF